MTSLAARGPHDLAAIFREHAPYVWRVLRRMGVREADVEDVTQEVFVVVHRRLPEFEGRSAMRTWIYGICLRVASDHRRRGKRLSGVCRGNSALARSQRTLRDFERQPASGRAEPQLDERRTPGVGHRWLIWKRRAGA